MRVIAVPYDDGKRGHRMGAGPEFLLANGYVTADSSSTIDVPADDDTLQTVLDLDRALAGEIKRAPHDRTLILSGNCNVALGACAAIPERPLAVIWFDAHGDFNTPETTKSEFIDGMALAMLTGVARGAWRVARLIDESHVVLVGARDLDPAEADALSSSRIACAASPGDLQDALSRIPRACARAYVHVDIDVLDTSEGRANTFAVSGGLTLDALLQCIDAIAVRFTWDVATISAYDPAADSDGRIARALARVAKRLATSD